MRVVRQSTARVTSTTAGARLTAAAALAGLALALAACSSSSSGSGGGNAGLTGKVNNHGTKTVSGGTLEVEADDYYFEPTIIKAKAGTKLTLEIKNEGKAVHTFTSPKLNVDKQLSPGQSATVTVTVPASGSAQFHCTFHESMGMQGAVEAT
jgi:plastocyanin